MVENIQRALASLNKKKDASEKGFSLIELIVVVAILGILVAIAIPVYNGLQDRAQENAIATIAANAATQAAADIAAGNTVDVSNLEDGDITVSVVGDVIEDVCATATDGTITKTAGPGC